MLKDEPSGYCGYIANEGGKPICESAMRKRFDNLLRQAGVEHCGIHSLRHTFASKLYELTRGDSKLVSELIRHSSVSFTEEIYIHLKDKYKQDTNYLFFKPHFRHYALGIGGIIFAGKGFLQSLFHIIDPHEGRAGILLIILEKCTQFSGWFKSVAFRQKQHSFRAALRPLLSANFTLYLSIIRHLLSVGYPLRNIFSAVREGLGRAKEFFPELGGGEVRIFLQQLCGFGCDAGSRVGCAFALLGVAA